MDLEPDRYEWSFTWVTSYKWPEKQFGNWGHITPLGGVPAPCNVGLAASNWGWKTESPFLFFSLFSRANWLLAVWGGYMLEAHEILRKIH